LLRGGPGDLPVVHTLYDCYVEWNECLTKFPKTQRYVLGETISRHLLGALEIILAASSYSDAKEKLDQLKKVSAKIDTLKLLIRLAKDSKCITNVQYLSIESRLVDAGKMLGGWIKHIG
jgi:hypothetical protein